MPREGLDAAPLLASVGVADQTGGITNGSHVSHVYAASERASERGFGDSFVRITVGSRTKSFQQRYLSSWQTNKFYVLVFFFFFFSLPPPPPPKRDPTQLTQNKHSSCATSWHPGWGRRQPPPLLA